jgi:hypothetical protein
MPLNQLKNTRSRWNLFSKVDQLGAIDFWTLTISLDSLLPEETAGVTVKDLATEGAHILSLTEYERRNKVLTLAAHEYTHFLDATSSLWGLQHLCYINACDSLDLRDENQFHVLKESHDYMRSIRLPDYYTNVNPSLPTHLPWRSAVSCGVLFSRDGKATNRSVLFVNFYTADKERFVRSPLSMVSLLEASAMAKEIEVRFSQLNRLASGERQVERHQIQRELLDYIYNPKITEYSACFHLMANVQDEKDLGVVSRGTGVLARIVINIPTIAFNTAAKHIDAYASAMNLQINDLEVERIRFALEQKNRGALFFLIAVLLPKSILQHPSTFHKGVEAALKTIGLSFEKLRRAAFEEADYLYKSLSKSKLETLKVVAKSGYENFTKIFPSGLYYQLDKLALPPSLHGDTQMTPYRFNPGLENPLANLDLEAAYDDLIRCQLRAENFAEACL